MKAYHQILPIEMIVGVIFACLPCLMAASPPDKKVLTQRISLHIKGIPQSEQTKINGDYIISSKGTLYLPLLKKPLKLSGLKSSQMAREIERAYIQEGIYLKPVVSATLPSHSLG